MIHGPGVIAVDLDSNFALLLAVFGIRSNVYTHVSLGGAGGLGSGTGLRLSVIVDLLVHLVLFRIRNID